MNPYADMKRARLRAANMGRYHAFRPEFNRHKLAVLMNFIEPVMTELEQSSRDYLYVLHDWWKTACLVNKHCDANRIEGDEAAQYWLELFLWHDSQLLKRVANVAVLA